MPGDDIQVAVDARPVGTTFCLAAGTYVGQEVRPKAGNSFLGAAGAVLDGRGSSIAFRPTADRVTIRSLTIQGYEPGEQVGAIQGGGHDASDGRSGWRIEGNVIRRNDGMGIRIGNEMVVRNNRILSNGQLGIGGIGDGTVVESNEIAFNNPDNAYETGYEAGGSKFVLTNGLVVRNNFVHHNIGPGLWTDIENRGTLYEENLVEDNSEMGIFHEISFAAIIRGNTVRRNGFGMQRWCYGAGILVAHSSDVTVEANVVEENWNGIVGLQQAREKPVYQLRNLDVRDNTVVMTKPTDPDPDGNGSYAGAVCQDSGETRVFDEWNNRFHDNTYDVADTNARLWGFGDERRTWTAWQHVGQDVEGDVALG